MSTSPDTMTIKQTAARLGVSRPSIYAMIAAGQLRTVRIAGGWQRVVTASVDEFLAVAPAGEEGRD